MDPTPRFIVLLVAVILLALAAFAYATGSRHAPTLLALGLAAFVLVPCWDAGAAL